MASILDMYGIKEVADVTFYRIDGNNKYTPVLYLDTLKVSTIEETASSTDATGGKGNAKLIPGTMVRKSPLLLKMLCSLWSLWLLCMVLLLCLALIRKVKLLV